MPNAVKLVLGLAGLLLAGSTSFMFLYKPALLIIAVPLVLVWAVWLMVEYLRWAKTLGKK
jgi:hypothetical protein